MTRKPVPMPRVLALPDFHGVMAASTLVFFRPTEAFWAFMGQVPWRWKGYHEAGAGTGHLTAEMKKRGFCVRAYDLYPRDVTEAEVECLDTAHDLWIGNCECVIIARPCHGTGWIEATIRHATENGDALYVSKPKNIRSDLAGFVYEVVAKKVGEDGESLVRVYGHKSDCHEQRLIVNSGRQEWWWFNAERNRYVNCAGGMAGFDVDGQEILAKRKRAHDDQIYLPKAVACDDSKDSGWIAPDGEFFGCGYAAHDSVAHSVIGCTVAQLETSGWVRAYGEVHGKLLWTFGMHNDDFRRKPTPAQCKVLRAKGYKVEPGSGRLLADKTRA